MIKLMEKVNILIEMVLCMIYNGKTINSMDLEFKYGQIKLNIKEIFNKGKKTDLESFIGKMGLFILGNFLIII